MLERVVCLTISVTRYIRFISLMLNIVPNQANREASIVTAIPGTTRDVLQLTLDIGGLPVVVADTAGLRETDDVVEGIGVQRGIEAYVLFSVPDLYYM